MGSRPVWRPWNSMEELLTVRDQLFSGRRKGENDERRKGCRMVSIWRVRGELPHAIDSTAMLVEAILADEARVLSPLATRMLYAGAFCRVITGLVDTGPGRQLSTSRRAARKLSMYERAKQLSLPTSFVGLRHDATHGDIPSIHALKQAIPKALSWLWTDFWRNLCLPRRIVKLPGAFADDVDSFKDHLRGVLTRYHEVAFAQRERKLVHDSTQSCLELVRLCVGNDAALTELAMIMIEWGMLAPDSKSHDLGKPIDEDFVLWDPLIMRLCSHQQPFFKALTDQMSIQLILPSGPMDVSLDRYREVMTMWLEHIFATKRYVPTLKRAKYDINHILSTCVHCQNYWTVRLVRQIMAVPGYESTKKNYRERVDNAIPHLAAGPNPSIAYHTMTITQEVEDPATGEKVAEKVEHKIEEDAVPGLWKPANPNTWKAKPFGCGGFY